MPLRRNKGDVEFHVGEKRYVLPSVDVVSLPIEYASAEELARFAAGRLLEKVELPSTVSSIEVGLHEGFGKSAWVSSEVRRTAA